MLVRDLSVEFLKNYCERRLRPSTVRGYRVNLHRHVLPRFGDCELQLIDVDDLVYLFFEKL